MQGCAYGELGRFILLIVLSGNARLGEFHSTCYVGMQVWESLHHSNVLCGDVGLGNLCYAMLCCVNPLFGYLT